MNELTIAELPLPAQATVAIRVVTVVAAVLAAALMLVLNTVRHHRRELTSFGQVMTRVGVTMLFLAVAWATIEAHVFDVPPAPRMFVLLGALIWADVGLVASLREQRKG